MECILRRYFNAGLRIFDISDPQLPKEVGYFIPPERPGSPEHAGAHASPVNWSEEVAVDARGNIFLNDDKWGTFVLRYTGKVPAKQLTTSAANNRHNAIIDFWPGEKHTSIAATNRRRP